jgi:hypothetical protein
MKPRSAAQRAGAIFGGAIAKQQGKAFQSELDAMHTRWRTLGIGAIQQGNPAIIRRGRDVIIVGKGGVDYVGHLAGVPVAYEAKSRSGATRLELLDRKGRDNEDAECRFLLDYSHHPDALGFYLVRDPTLRRCYIVHVREHLETLLAGGSVRLRRDLNDKTDPGAAVVPCIEYPTEQEILITLGRRRDLWPWPKFLLPHLEVPQ